MDFTLKTYKQLLYTLINQNYSFFTFQEYIENNSSLIAGNSSIIILRHDVDRLPENALRVAELEKRLGVRGSYYFRVVKQSFDAGIIREIAAMGHEIGYHYENLAKAGQRLEVRGQGKGRREKGKTEDERMRGCEDEEGKKEKESLPTQNSKLKTQNSIFELAIEDFKRNLERLRKLCPIKTICMHGSPLSKYDSRDLWKVYDYRDFGIIGEPYFDVDFNEVLYLTDTGRRWDGEKYSVRDKISSQPSAFSSQQTKGVGIWGLGFGKRKAECRMLNAERCDQETVKSEARISKFETNSNDQNSNDRNINQKMKNLSTSQSHIFSSSEDSSFSTNEQINNLTYSFHSTIDIINAIKEGLMPDKIMINIHPQRWTNKPFSWVKELIWQNVKNVGKRFLVVRRGSD